MKSPQTLHMGSRILDRIRAAPEKVWTPSDFVDLGKRDAVDKALQRLAKDKEIRRIDWGLYDLPRKNRLTGQEAVPDYQAVIEAVTKSNKARYVVDGMTAANDLGLTTAVPAKIEVLVDNRLKPIKLGRQKIHFKSAAPSRLYWADRPAMRVVQALYWMQERLSDADQRAHVIATLRRLLAGTDEGKKIREDLRNGISVLPIWMQELVRNLISHTPNKEKRT
jgi:Family of unknown function (DUF6088)